MLQLSYVLGTRTLWLLYALGTRTLLWVGHVCSGDRMLLEHECYYGLGIDTLVNYCIIWKHECYYGSGALVIVCSWNMEVFMVWAWMLWLSYALGTRVLLWFGHGCSSDRMLSENECNYGLSMDALVTVCSWKTKVSVVWARMLLSSYSLGT